MKPFPPPPGHTVSTPAEQTPVPTRQRGLKPIDKNDVSYLLSCNLKPQHRDDPTVLKFIASYLVCRDIRQASKDAGIHTNSGRSLRNKRDVNAAIVAITDTAVLKHNLDPSEIVQKVVDVMEVDIAEFENEDGSYKARLTDVSPEIRRAVKEFKVKNLYERDANGMKIVVGQLIEVKLYDKMKSAELLGRETNLFKETKKLEMDATDNMKDILLASVQRAELASDAIDVTGTVVESEI